LIARLKKGWHELRAGRPGRRFQDRYQRVLESAACGALKKWALVAGGALVIVAGIILLPLPGPGMLIIAAGALLMAERSRAAARALDWLELKARRLVGR
jgi:hypothetical protein